MNFDLNNNKLPNGGLANKTLDYIYRSLCDQQIELNEIEDLNYVDDCGYCLILLASIYGDLNLVQKLISTNEVIYTDCYRRLNANNDPLHMAVKFEHYELVEYLVEVKKVYLDVFDSHGCTPLYYSIEKGNGDLFDYLIKRGSNFRLVKENPFRLAVNSLNIDFINQILPYLSDKHTSTYNPFTDLIYSYCYALDFKRKLFMFDYLLKHPKIKINDDTNGDRTLHNLIRFNKFRTLKLLILNNYDVDKLNFNELPRSSVQDGDYCVKLLAVLKLVYFLGTRFRNVLNANKLTTRTDRERFGDQASGHYFGNQQNFFFMHHTDDDQTLVRIEQTHVYQEFVDWLSKRPKILNLQHLSRIALRKHFNKNLIPVVSHINYPFYLVNYLNLDDLVDYLDLLDTI